MSRADGSLFIPHWLTKDASAPDGLAYLGVSLPKTQRNRLNTSGDFCIYDPTTNQLIGCISPDMHGEWDKLNNELS